MADGIFDWIIMRECMHSISCKELKFTIKKILKFYYKEALQVKSSF